MAAILVFDTILTGRCKIYVVAADNILKADLDISILSTAVNLASNKICEY